MDVNSAGLCHTDGTWQTDIFTGATLCVVLWNACHWPKLTMAPPWTCSMLRSAALQVSMVPITLVCSRASMSSGLVLSSRASLSEDTGSEKAMTSPCEYRRWACPLVWPVDSSSVHQVGDSSTAFVNGVKGLLDFLWFGNVTAEGHVFVWGAETEWLVTWTHQSYWGLTEANENEHLIKSHCFSLLVWGRSLPPGRDATVVFAASLFLDTTATLWPLSASSCETEAPIPLEPPQTTASLDVAL